MSKKAELKLDKETYKALKEFTVLSGAEDESEFIRNLIETWVKSQYGLEDLDRYTLKDLLLMLNALYRVFNFLLPIMDGMTRLSQITRPIPQLEEQPQQPPQDERLEELNRKIEALSSSLDELKEVLALRGEKEQEVAERPTSTHLDHLDMLEEMRGEIITMFANAMRHAMRQMLGKMMAASQ